MVLPTMQPLICRAGFRACLTVLAFSAALPAAGKEPGWYVGGSVGYGRSQIDNAGAIADAILQGSGGFTSAQGSADASSIPVRFFFGYDLGKYFGIEGGPFYIPGTGWNVALSSPLGGANASGRTDVLGLNLDVLFKLPLGDRWRLFARGGGLYAQSRFKLSADGAAVIVGPTEFRERDVGWKAGAGVQYSAFKDVAFRLEWERYRVNDGLDEDLDIDAYSLSVLYYW
jgi:opacity protein-like surface antigen